MWLKLYRYALIDIQYNGKVVICELIELFDNKTFTSTIHLQKFQRSIKFHKHP